MGVRGNCKLQRCFKEAGKRSVSNENFKGLTGDGKKGVKE